MTIYKLKAFILIWLFSMMVASFSFIGCGGGSGGDGGNDHPDVNGGGGGTGLSVPYIEGVPYSTQSQINSPGLCTDICSPSFLKFMPAACAAYCPSNINSGGLSYLKDYFANVKTSNLQNKLFENGGYGGMTQCMLGGCQPGWYCSDIGEGYQCVKE